MTSWQLMVRLAWRDLQRHRGRAFLTASLVALPALVLAALASAVATLTVSNGERLPADLGAAPAAVSVATPPPSVDASNIGVRQANEDPQSLSDIGVPGHLLHGKPATSAAAVAEITGGTTYPMTVSDVRVVVGERRIRATTLGVDGQLPIYTGTATLTSGRWPRTTSEVLVTDAGSSIGIPTHGRFFLHRSAGPDRAVTVVGTARTPDAQDLVGLPDDHPRSRTFLIDRKEPVTWTDVQRWNSYGLAVRSRMLIEHPDQVPPNPGWSTSNSAPDSVVVLLLVGAVLLTVLVAGPAFTTSADRHRHALGQLASNGATRAMLRRYVLAQAILLGALTAVGAVALGSGLGLFAIAVARRLAPRHSYGPPDLPWTQLGVLALVTVLSALAAALVPAFGAARVSVVAVLRGHVSPREVRAGWPVLGLVLAGAGGGLLWHTITSTSLSGGEAWIAAGGVLLFGGAVLALPWLLARVAGLAGVLPVAGRIATRDIGRQRTRATSGVAAVMAATALMTALAIGGTSDIAQSKRDYLPVAPIGDAVVRGDAAGLTSFVRTARTVDPHLTTTTLGVLGTAQGANVDPGSGQLTDVFLATAPGCPAPNPTGTSSDSPDCLPIGWAGTSAFAVMTPADAGRVLGLTATERDWLAAGNVLGLQGPQSGVVNENGKVPNIVPDAIVRAGRMRIAWDRVAIDSPKQLRHAVTVPVKVVPANSPPRQSFARAGNGFVVTPATAAAHHWPTSVQEIRLHAAGGISGDVEQELSDRTPDNVYLTVERGYQDKSLLIIGIMIGAFALIALIVTLIGTALAQSESRADQATLAAVGAPRSIRRRIGGGYALAIGLVGGAVGFLVGLVPGIAVTWPLTIESWDPLASHEPLIDIPWLPLLAALIGTPVLAAIVAMATTRSSPPLTRRQA